jgi:hypothetical protein
MGVRNRVGVGLSYRHARLHTAWWNWFLEIDSWAPQKFKNSGSVEVFMRPGSIVADLKHYDVDFDPSFHFDANPDTLCCGSGSGSSS